MVRVPREYPTHRTERDEWGTQSCGALEWSAKWNVWATRPRDEWGTQSCGALEWSAKWNVWATRPVRRLLIMLRL